MSVTYIGRGNIRSMVICLNSGTDSSEEINYYSIGGSMTVLSLNFYTYIYTYTKVLFVAVLRRCSVKNIYAYIIRTTAYSFANILTGVHIIP